MHSVLELTPTTNYAVASVAERSDQMESLARVLMGLSHPLQLIAQARPTTTEHDWTRPPLLERRWLAVITAEDSGALEWRTRTLRNALEGVGLRTSDFAASYEEHNQEVRPDGIRLDGAWCASLVLRRWPREVAPGWLGQALAGDLPVDASIHVIPQDAQRVARMLKGQETWQDDGGKDPANKLGKRDAAYTRERMIARQDRPVKVAVVLTVYARDRYQLKNRADTLRHEIGLALADVRLAKYEQDRGLAATLPTGRCELLGAYRTLDCTSTASTWMFQPATVNHVNGAELGTTHDGSMLVRLDPFDPSLESFGGIVLAKVGMGKSFLLKLLCRRLHGVEVLIVEQRTPAEYASVAGARSFNLADIPYAERASRLRDFVSELWAVAKSDPKPRLLILDELWSLLRNPELASLIEEIARIGRHHYLSLWIATQQVKEMLDSDGGLAVLNNAAIRVYLKQHDNDLDKLCNAVGLPAPARRFLRSAARGQALLDCGGLLIPTDIQASPDEHRAITTDPREKVRDVRVVDSGNGSDEGREGEHLADRGSGAVVVVAP